MTTYLTATQAASKLHCSEKTVRRWITEGRITAFHPQGRKNRLAIAESDIERLAQELAQFETPAEQGPDTSSLVERLNQLEQEFNDYRLLSGPDLLAAGPGDIAHIENRLDALDTRISELEQLVRSLIGTTSHVGTPLHTTEVAIDTRATKTRPTASTVSTELPLDVPTGSVLAVDFAKAHNVSPATFRDHVRKELTPSLSIPNPARPGQFTWYLTPEQQQRAIDFWTRNRTRYSPNPDSYPAIKYPGVQSESSEQISEGPDTTDTSSEK